MTFLSRLRLHPRDLLVISDLADITGLHRTLMRAFPQHNGGAARAEFGVLFRLEPRSNPPIALVQSNIQPEWAQLPEGYVLAARVKRDQRTSRAGAETVTGCAFASSQTRAARRVSLKTTSRLRATVLESR